MMKIAEWITKSTALLQSSGIDSARLDSLMLLEYVLGKSRVTILTHLDEVIPNKALQLLDESLDRRQKREPIAYIIGKKEFYGREFIMSNAVLIPRPESEAIIDEVVALNLEEGSRIADVGTGSGILAITLAIELPKSRVDAYDINAEALEIAKKNSQLLQANVHFFQGDLLESAQQTYNVIVANLPYVSDSQYVSPETAFEPKLALYAEDDGLLLIKKLITQIQKHKLLHSKGYIVLESEPRQHNSVRSYSNKYGLRLINTQGFVQKFQFED